jgi:hypothetical protein
MQFLLLKETLVRQFIQMATKRYFFLNKSFKAVV